MANTSTRTLRLLSLLQTHRYWPGTELAERLGVSVHTLRRDIDRLRKLGYPVEAQRGVDGGYELAAGAALPPLVIDDEEAVALAVGLQAAAQGAMEGIAESSVRALAKVVQVMLAASTAHPLIGRVGSRGAGVRATLDQRQMSAFVMMLCRRVLRGIAVATARQRVHLQMVYRGVTGSRC
jgi:predicted DNA-binding transcriptional regulator YafY